MNRYLLILFVLVACQEPFEPPLLEGQAAIVVDGVVTDEFKAHEVTLSRSSPLDTVLEVPVSEASVQIVENDERVFTLSEFTPGRYRSTFPFSGTIGSSYQLRLEIEGQQYESAPVILKANPAIDNVDFRLDTREPSGQRGLQVLLSTTPSESTFFRWEWQETYEIRSPYPRRYEWVNDEFVEFDPFPVSVCWNADSSRTVIVASTQQLEAGSASSFEIRFLNEGDPKLLELYSIEIKQFAMDEQAFDFWRTIRDIGERQGSIFDLQPGLVLGNMRAVNNNNVILGYFDATQLRTVRSFVGRSTLARLGLSRNNEFRFGCTEQLDTIPRFEIETYLRLNGEERNVIGFLEFAGNGWLTGPKECTDCRFQGSNERPSFWP
ncbi:MAG: DUF4249 domain-containing protein [Bacteroidota bacterium]